MPLAELQALTANEGRINAILISNQGDVVGGAQHTDVVISALKPLLEGTGLEAAPVKKDALAQADTMGSAFSSIFLLFGQFSVGAGILLIFLIFVMLAAERKRELGIARAVGAQRDHIIRLFVFEGSLYALMAAGVGSLVGVAVGWGMVRILTVAFGQMELQLSYSFNWRSIVIAFTMGMVLTFVVVLVSSWRVSRLNIIRAIRDIPEPRNEGRSVKGLAFTALALVAGVLLTFASFQSEQASIYLLGVSLIIIASPLLARRLGLPNRAAFTIAELGLLVWWMATVRWHKALLPFVPDMQMGIEAFFLSAIMLVLGAVWTVIYNSDILLTVTMLVLGRVHGILPILKTAVSYPMQNRFRTGVALALFSMVVFTLVVMSFIIYSVAGVYEDTDSISGGYPIRATTSYANPIGDIRAALQEADGVSLDDFAAIGTLNGDRAKVKQEGTNHEPVDFVLQGVDAGYSDNTNYGFALMAPGYDSARQIWQALQTEPDTAVVSHSLVPSRTNFAVNMQQPTFQLEGFWADDSVLPETHVLAQNPQTGKEMRLRVIGVLESTAFYVRGVVTSQGTLNSLVSQPVPPQMYMFRLKDGVSAEMAAKALRSRFLQNGMQAEVLAEEIRKNGSSNIMINNLLQGFMGLGLVVGIAALGVIAARSVVERRQQIGVLRALGYAKSMVQASFLLESSFVALLGITIGVTLGFTISYNVLSGLSSDLPGISYRIPWVNIVIVVAVANGASLLTTYLPARQAADIYPAEALRSE